MTDTDTATPEVALYDQSADTEPDAPDELRPAWLPKNFSTPEMLVKSYSEAQKKLTLQGQQLGEYSRENERLEEELNRLASATEIREARLAALEQAYIARSVGAQR